DEAPAPASPAAPGPTLDKGDAEAASDADAPPDATTEPAAAAAAPAAGPKPADPTGGDDEGDADRRRVLVIAAVAFLLIAAVAFVLTRGGDDDETTGSTTTPPGQVASDGDGSGGGAITISGSPDSFNRDDRDDGLGALPSGAPWVVQSGAWALRSGEAVVAQPEAERRNTVYVATGYPDPMAQVRLTTIANGAGMVFRYQGECNFWAVYAVPEFATWNVEKVVDCARVGAEEGSPVYRTITNAPVGDGTTVGVVLSGEQVQIVLNGTIALTFEDPDLAGVGRLGLTSRGTDDVAFDDFVAGGPGGQGVVAATTTPGDDPTTTAAEGDDGDDPTTTAAEDAEPTTTAAGG
ncbi:MAG TPA: hypothetical protein VK507_25530, partial [Iamia sp.]|nr:hypothetical protein [Iamia sp.]